MDLLVLPIRMNEENTLSLDLQMERLSLNATLADLPSFQCQVSSDTLGRVVGDLLNTHKDLPGVIVTEGGHICGLISRRKYLESVGKLFGLEVFTNRPIRIMLEQAPILPLVFPAHWSVHEAALTALSRTKDLVEPVVVQFTDGSFRLIDLQTLLLAQSRILALTNQVIQRQNEISETLRAAGVELSTTFDLQLIFQVIFRNLKHICSFHQSVVYLSENGLMKACAYSNSGKIGSVFPLEDSVLMELQRVHRSLIFTKTKVQPQKPSGRVCDWMLVPLVSNGEMIGVLTLEKYKGENFADEIDTIIQTFANQAASAIQNARLYQFQKERAWELEVLNQATGSLISTLDPLALLNQILTSAVGAVTAADEGILYLLDVDSAEYVVGASYNQDDRHMGDPVFSFEQTQIQAAIENHKPIIYKDAVTVDLPGSSHLLAPFMDQGNPVAVLSLKSKEQSGFSDTDLQLMAVFCATATAALRNSRLHAEVEQMAVADPLTGLLNRRGFYRLARQEIDRALRYSHALCLIMIDIDHFKKVNDTFGHDAGDRVIQMVSEKCCQHLRGTDLSCRFGGEEFVILLPETGLQEAVWVAERLRTGIAQTTLVIKEGTLTATVSLGVVQLDPAVRDVGRSLELLLNQVDHALYSSKTAGRNRVTIWNGLEQGLNIVSRPRADSYEFSQLAETLQKKEAELRWIEASHQATQEQLANILQNASEAIISINSAHRILVFNKSAERMFGYGVDEMIGKDLGEILPTDSALLDQLLSSEDGSQKVPAARLNLVGRRKEKNEFSLEASHSSFGVNGQRIHTIILTDITERKLAAEEILRANLELSQAYDATIEGWAHALEFRDLETHGHSKRVVAMTLKLAACLGLSDTELTHLRRGALLHDIGKLSIPDHILFKPGSLDEQEWEIMKSHSSIGYEILSPITFLRPALDIPHFHHEHWDGTGYPLGLAGEQIPLPARIFAIVDVWDALRSDRPYRKAWNYEDTRSYIRHETGHLFDPEIALIFLKMLDEEVIS